MNAISRWVRALYEWIMAWAESPYGVWILFLVAFAESSFFPIPPDPLLIALCIAASSRAIWFASVATAGSVLGGLAGYWIGYQFFDLLGRPIVDFYGLQQAYVRVQSLYREWDAIAVGIAGFTPIPYKVFTIAAGAFELNIATFAAASLVSRGARFLIIGGLVWWFGPWVRRFIERYLNLLAVLFVVLLVGGFLIVKYAIK